MRAHRRPDRKSARAASYGARLPSESGDVAAYLACVWALVFAAVHLYWVSGGTVGLPPGMIG